MDGAQQTLLNEFARGAQMIFDNAEQLCREAGILRENGALSRALGLHQLSNEECGKLELLGGYAMSVISGRQIDLRKLAKALRDHEAKNHANAYHAAVTEEERAARERGDFSGSSRAFKALQTKLHSIFNTNKNAALYVNFEGGIFSAPRDTITAELVAEMSALNEYFLRATEPYVRLFRRVADNEWQMQDASIAYFRRMDELASKFKDDPVEAHRIAFREMYETVKPAKK